MGKYSGIIKKLPVFIGLGQSNLDGRGYRPTHPTYGQNGDLSLEYKIHGTNSNMQIFWRTAWNTVKNGSWQNFDLYDNNLNPNAMHYVLFGFESPFLKQMSDYKNEEVYLIKATEGGTSLYSHWATTGYTYKNAVAHIQDGLENLISKGIPDLKPITWFQGWSDSDTQAHADAYENNLNNLISNIDAVIDAVLIGRKSKWLICESPDWVSRGTRDPLPYNALIIAQSNVGNNGDNLFLPKTNMVLWDDNIHLTGASFEQLGVDLFNILKDE